MIGRRQPLDPLAQRKQRDPMRVRVATSGGRARAQPSCERTAEGFRITIPLSDDASARGSEESDLMAIS